MDRNHLVLLTLSTCLVALRKESVDRNLDTVQIVVVIVVALRKESVDRNNPPVKSLEIGEKSLSARRAWIEMLAPRLADMSAACRSPQGERG